MATNLSSEFCNLANRFRRIDAANDFDADRQLNATTAWGAQLLQRANRAGYLELQENFPWPATRSHSAEQDLVSWSLIWLVLAESLERCNATGLPINTVGWREIPQKGAAADALIVHVGKRRDWRILAENYAVVADWFAKHLLDSEATGGKPKRKSGQARTPSRFTDADQLIISALRLHHKYESPQGDGFASIGNTEAATYRQLCDLSSVKSTDTVKSFFGKWFPDGGNDEYKRACRGGAKKLGLEIARLVPGDVPSFSGLLIDKEA